MSHNERQQMMVDVLTPNPGDPAGGTETAARQLWSWEQFALHLTLLIGDGGFQSQYARTAQAHERKVVMRLPMSVPGLSIEEVLGDLLREDCDFRLGAGGRPGARARRRLRCLSDQAGSERNAVAVDRRARDRLFPEELNGVQAAV